MARQRFTFFVPEASKAYISQFKGLSDKTVMIENNRLDSYRELLLKSNLKLALLAHEDYVAYWNKKLYPHKFLNICNERLMAVNYCIYLHKTSCMTPEINKHVLLFNSNGLMQISKHFYADRAYLKKKPIDDGPKKLTVDQLKGGYLFFVFGVILSIISFVLEIILKRLVT